MVDLVVLYHGSISNAIRLYLFVFVWISRSCPTLHINTHMIPQLCQWRHGDTTVLTGSDKMDTEWGWGKRRAENESRCLEGGRGERERERVEMGGMHPLEHSNRSYLMFVYLDIDSLYSSISPSISPSIHTHPTCTHFIPVIVCTSHVIVPTPPYSSTASLPRLST